MPEITDYTKTRTISFNGFTDNEWHRFTALLKERQLTIKQFGQMTVQAFVDDRLCLGVRKAKAI